jgi:coenzyme Q-binding protein COQ10
MPRHEEILHVPYSPEQCFALVKDVENYPKFLPWCKAARILSSSEHLITAELVIAFHHLRESYTSRITLTPCSRIDVHQTSGPFEHLDTIWQFSPQEQGEGCTIHFAIDFRFRSKMLDMLIGSLFHKATQKMTSAFVQRSHTLYAASS